VSEFTTGRDWNADQDTIRDAVAPGIPAASRVKRVGPALDPVARMRLAAIAKWILLLGILLLVAWFPTATVSTEARRLAAVAAGTIFAAVVATGLPRTFLPDVYGLWFDAVEAFRDWVIVGLTTGGLYWLVLKGLRALVAAGLCSSPFCTGGAGGTGGLFDPVWLEYRLPLVLFCAAVGVFVARRVSMRSEGIVASDPGQAVFQIGLQSLLIGLLARPFEIGFNGLAAVPHASQFLLFPALGCIAAAGGIILWGYRLDSRLIALHRRGHEEWSGVDASDDPIPMTITIVGGRESGKTVLMAAAYYEWTTQSIGDLRISPANMTSHSTGGFATGGTDLEKVATDLYVNYEFPAGTVASQNLPFDLKLGSEPVSRFSILDYPGGATTGRAADRQVIEQFWDRVENTDALMLIADMSYVRRGKLDKDYLQVYNAYKQVMQRLVDRNGKQRVIPVALVLTKCDEFVDPDTGQLDVQAIEEGLERFRYREIEVEWRRLNSLNGPATVEFTTWVTSAVTYSEPQVDEYGNPDVSLPFRLFPPPPQIEPTGCAAPLLWLTGKVMRWNVTMYRDLSGFLLGSPRRGRRRIDAVLELERIADSLAAKV
jgi:hypothetical protein